MNLAEAAFSLPLAFLNHALSGLIVVGLDENNRPRCSTHQGWSEKLGTDGRFGKLTHLR